MTDSFCRKWGSVVRGVASKLFQSNVDAFGRLAILSPEDLEQELWCMFAEGIPVADSPGHVATRARHYGYNLLRRSKTGKASVDTCALPHELQDDAGDAELEREEALYFRDPAGYEAAHA